jgi:Zn-dependent protease with chaperone function
MDFFAAQAAARRRTAVLVVYFALAWLGTIAIFHLGVGLLLSLPALAPARALVSAPALVSGPALLAWTAGGVTLVTACGSAFHAARLARDGGHAVARMVGGVPVERGTTDAAQRRLVNVVEEMAIASGLPVPAVYVLPDEGGINAFAAGFTRDRAVVAVTRGALDALTRDELQGVIAHELSHVLNEDVRLNMRLVALIGGITVLALVGRVLARGAGGGRRARLGGRGRAAVALVGVCLWLAGSVGAFFGRLIRAAVSRQREFLADAASVQFTRNPDGLAGALAKISLQGSALASAQAPEVSHLFFANGLSSRWLATHPPIAERIRRIAPHGVLRAARRAAEAAEAAQAAAARPVAAPSPAAGASTADAAVLGASALAASVGHPGPSHLSHAADLLAGLPAGILAAARDAHGAAALARALVAGADPIVREVALGHVADAAARADAGRLAAALAGASREDRMAILDLALPALDGLSRQDAAALVADLAALAAADGRVTVFEWAVQRIVRRRVAQAAGERRPAPRRQRTVGDVEIEALEMLSTLAWLGASDEAGAQAALDAGAASLGVRGWRLLPRDRVRAARLDAALAWMDGSDLALKGRLLAACAACVLADGHAGAAEAEVVRAIAASLGLPMPLLVPAAATWTQGVA